MLSKKRFRAYLEKYKNETVGYAWMGAHCPIACHLREELGPNKLVRVLSTGFYINDKRRQLPDWAVEFVATVDDAWEKGDAVSGAVALDILGGRGTDA